MGRPWDSVAFVQAWMESQTVEAVCERIGRNLQEVRSYASVLRKKGVKLPLKGGRGARINVEALNGLLAGTVK